MQIRTVQVGNLSDLAGEKEINEFFSFSGEIEHIEIRRGINEPRDCICGVQRPPSSRNCLVVVGICDLKSELESRILVKTRVESDPVIYYTGKANTDQGSTIVDRIVSVTAAENYVPRIEMLSTSPRNTRVYVTKAQDVVTSMLRKGSAFGQDAMNKAKAFDEKHGFTANASAKAVSFDRRVGLTEKITVGFSVVNEKVKSVDQRLHVSDKTMAVLTVAEKKLTDTSSAVKTNRYVSSGTAWLNGAFSKVTRAGQIASNKTREKFQMAVSNLTAKDPIATA